MNLRLALSSVLLLPACASGDRPAGDDSTSSATAGTTAAAGTAGATGDASTSTGSTSHDHPATTGAWTTGAGPTTGTVTGDGTTTTTGGDVDPGCAMYCAAMMSSCAGELGQYASLDSCLGVCAALPPGSPGETAGNSLACRAYHAGMAAVDPALHCVHAGPGGAGVCGGNCEGFCAIAVATCPSEHPNLDACLTACAAFPDTEPYNIDDASGDTLACRLYHLGIAATSDADALVHCGHTVAASPPCQ